MPASTPDPPRDTEAWGLCASCAHHAAIANDRGSRFVRCGLAVTDPRFPKYPAVPVRQCPGYRVRSDDGDR